MRVANLGRRFLQFGGRVASLRAAVFYYAMAPLLLQRAFNPRVIEEAGGRERPRKSQKLAMWRMRSYESSGTGGDVATAAFLLDDTVAGVATAALLAGALVDAIFDALISRSSSASSRAPRETVGEISPA